MSTTPAADKKPKLPENELRVSPRTNVIEATQRIEKAFETFDHVVLSGINAGISKVLLIAEIAKLKIAGLHQYNLLETMTTEIKEETSDNTVEHQKFKTRFKVELYKTKPSTAPKGFYQAPYSEEELKKLKEFKSEEKEEGPRRGGFRGRGRGGLRGRGSRGGRGRGGEERRGRGGFRGSRGGNRGRGGERGRRGGERGAPRGRGADRGAPRGRGTETGKAKIPGL